MNNELLEKISEILIDVRNKKPIVHCITNNVTINDCANAILSVGGSPIMTNRGSNIIFKLIIIKYWYIK